MEIDSFFFDTYALYEIIRGNESYRKYAEGISFVTSGLNLMELYYCLLRKCGKKAAGRYYEVFVPHAVEIDGDSIKAAMEFRLAYADKNMSYADCAGYVFAVQNRLKFLTGNKSFKDLAGVEYVK
ncbi:MAG: PIN domain-containing protein [Candidatus Altiarchaeia archaeon]